MTNTPSGYGDRADTVTISREALLKEHDELRQGLVDVRHGIADIQKTLHADAKTAHKVVEWPAASKDLGVPVEAWLTDLNLLEDKSVTSRGCRAFSGPSSIRKR